jgi:chromosome segregation ATPase
LIAELRQQLYDLRNQDRDYRGVNDEIFSMENRYRMLSEDKARAEFENRARLDHAADDIAEARKQLEDLKFLLHEKAKQQMNLADEHNRSKRLLDQKHMEAHKLKDEGAQKANQVGDLRGQLSNLEREIETVKIQRSEMWREITRLKEISEGKAIESNHQQEKLNQLEHEIARTSSRIEDIQKVIDSRSHDLRNKSAALDETQREIGRCKDSINK